MIDAAENDFVHLHAKSSSQNIIITSVRTKLFLGPQRQTSCKIGAKLVADLLSVAGIDRLITMDLHADQIQGFFDVPVDHLYASGVILPYLQSLHLDDLVIASPDVGGSKRANTYANQSHLAVWSLVLLQQDAKRFANVVANPRARNIIACRQERRHH